MPLEHVGHSASASTSRGEPYERLVSNNSVYGYKLSEPIIYRLNIFFYNVLFPNFLI